MTGRWYAKYFPKFIIQWIVVGSLIRRLPVRRFFTSVVAACVVVLGEFAREVELKIFYDDSEASMSSRYDMPCATISEVGVQRLTEKDFRSLKVYGCLSGATGGPKKYDIFHSSIFWRIWSGGLR